MSEPAEMDQMDQSEASRANVSEATHARPARRLPRAVQVLLIVAGGAILAAWLLLQNVHLKDAATGAPAQEATANSFKPTAAQWAGFKTAPVVLLPFFASESADGKIAIDDDLTTAVYSPYSGRVTKLFVRAGDRVRAGDPLLAIAASEFVQASNDLVAALATGRTARAQLTLAQTTERRQHDLFLAQGGALKDWQQSQSDLANAQGNLNSAEVALGAVRNRLRILGKTDRDVAAMETTTDVSRFSPEAMVVAPISGTITQRQVGLGQNIVTLLNGGSTSIFTIGDTSRVWLVANAREVDAPRIRVGDPVEVQVLAFPGRIFKATVTYVGAGLDPTTHRLPLHAEIDNANGLLRPEMFATFRIITGEAKTAPAVPEQAIVYDPEGAHVWLAGADHTLSLRKVAVGRNNGGMVEVPTGLAAGDTVITSGSVFIDRAAEAD